MSANHKSINELTYFFTTYLFLIVPVLVACITTIYKKKSPSGLRITLFSAATVISIAVNCSFYLIAKEYLNPSFSLVIVLSYLVLIVLLCMYIARFVKTRSLS